MKHILLLGTSLALAASASATIVDSFYTPGGGIPDANPAGVSFSHTTTTANMNNINGVNVRLNLSGGYNGDLYGYLVFQATDNAISTTTILLNRVGRTGVSDAGFATSGMDVVLSSTGPMGNIHDVAVPAASTFGNVATYYQADTNYTHNANGTWTLFLADLSGGDQSTLLNWGLEISVVPEATTGALLAFGTLLAASGLRAARLRGGFRILTGCPGGQVQKILAGTPPSKSTVGAAVHSRPKFRFPVFRD
jgi:subtilisin-like proprotein convertase family protein